ncbi:MAG: phosphohistidine phosphatase SixA [Aeromonadaceae bacterium]|nr:phosphohistidine phosphatase SixA [Aeromonadaceae bacterium]
MKVVVMRHGDAVLGADDDAARALTSLGREQSRAMALWLQQQMPHLDRVLVSPYLRAQQTWQTVRELFGEVRVDVLDELVPHGHSAPVADYLRALEGEVENLLVISHLPLVGYLVADLCPVQLPPMFVTSAMVAVELQGAQGNLLWQQAPHLLKK